VPPKLRATVERQTLAEQVYASLKKAIVNGDLEPGERLKELEIAQSLGASRTPVREALSWLEQEGLVKPLRSGGMMVVELAESDVEEIYGLLQVLEGYGAGLAAARITAKQLDQLESTCDRADRVSADEPERQSELNWRFHELVLEASGHERLQEIVRRLRSAMHPYRAVTLASEEFRTRCVPDHRRVITLLRTRDSAGVQQLMSDHIGAARDVTVAELRRRAARLVAEK
jgi:DNA-binding GntR family transcriptional regulator